MRIRMKTRMAGPEGIAHPGQIIERERAAAYRLIEAGCAEQVGEAPETARAGMIAARVADSLRRAGEPVVLRRPGAPDVRVMAKVRQYGAADLVGGIVQGDWEVIVAHKPLSDAGFPVPPRKGDRVVIERTGTAVTAQHPGDRSGIGYWMHARGGT